MRRLWWIAESLLKYCAVFSVVVAVVSAVSGSWRDAFTVAAGALLYLGWIPLAVVFLAHVVTLATEWRFHLVLCVLLLLPLLVLLVIFPPLLVVGFFINSIFIVVSRDMPPLGRSSGEQHDVTPSDCA